MIRLSRQTLSLLDRRIDRPGYDPAAIAPGIVHLGLGNFHRAHMARYTDALIARDPAAAAWGIAGVGMLPADRPLIDALAAQDRLYSLTERDAAGERTRIIGTLAGVLHAPSDPAAVLSAIDRASIVSLTVTGHGYCLGADKRLDPAHAAIIADRADPGRPTGAIGLIVAGLKRRRDAGLPAFTALSCDNIEHNGAVLRQAVIDLAALDDPALADWIDRHARFPATMVDRITPVTRPADTAALASVTGIDDRAAVFCEPFTQWVIEDDFAAGRPAWETVGAQFVADVAPYEFMKLRLLNASHLAICAPAQLAGMTYVDQAMRAPVFRRYMTLLMARETAPTLRPVPGVDLAAYQATLIDRFANPTIADTVQRVNTDASLAYLLDPIRDRLAAGAPFPLLAFALAAWLRRMRGVDEGGNAIDLRHPHARTLGEAMWAGGTDPRPALHIEPVFGSLGHSEALAVAAERSLTAIERDGVTAALAAATV